MTTPIQKNKDLDLSYYLTLYKMEGHTTWRANLSGYKDGFEKQWENQKEGKVPKITEKLKMRIDRLTGTFKELK